MAEELIQDFENHIIKCRCCLKDFEIDDTQIKITAIVQSRFKDLTQLEVMFEEVASHGRDSFFDFSLQLKISEKYSEVICEPCNIELKTISAFRKELISKQRNLSEFVEGFVEDFGQEEELELVKHEAEENVVIKAEPDCEVHEDYSMFINTEYLEGLQDEVVDASGEEFQGEEFAYVKAEKGSYASAYPRSKGMKKHYKRFEGSKAIKNLLKIFFYRALCGLCGNSYYKDQLQRHIDKVHYKVKRCKHVEFVKEFQSFLTLQISVFCDICGFGSFLKCNMSQHITKHVAKEYRVQILCTLCPATFTRHESLKNHMKTEHDSNPEMLKCFCGKEFNLRHKLTTHIKRTHNNARDHACDFSSCSKRFFTPKELKVHILKCHTPNYVDRSEHFCEVKSRSENFQRNSFLVLQICGKKYSSSKSLRTHMKHHQEPGEFDWIRM